MSNRHKLLMLNLMSGINIAYVDPVEFKIVSVSIC